MSTAIQRLTRWRDVGDGPVAYTAGDAAFGRDVAELLRENERLRAAMEEFARQKTEDEMSGEEYDSADVWGAYEMFIRRARAALK